MNTKCRKGKKRIAKRSRTRAVKITQKAGRSEAATARALVLPPIINGEAREMGLSSSGEIRMTTTRKKRKER